MRLLEFTVVAAVAACTRPAPSPRPVPAPASASISAGEDVAMPAASAPAAVDTSPAQLDPDGDDDPTDTGQPPLPVGLRFERVGRPPMALQRICDLTPLGDALYASHANQPLGTDGATITRYRPDDAGHPFAVAFDWNRSGEPTKGGGAGQGFLRAHAIDGRLFVPDTDPPYAGLGLVDPATEGYVFVSDASGAFARARMPGHRPPAAPEPGHDGKPGAGVLPRAYHVIDVVRFRGRLLRVDRLGAPERARLERTIAGSAARRRRLVGAVDLRGRLPVSVAVGRLAAHVPRAVSRPAVRGHPGLRRS